MASQAVTAGTGTRQDTATLSRTNPPKKRQHGVSESSFVARIPEPVYGGEVTRIEFRTHLKTLGTLARVHARLDGLRMLSIVTTGACVTAITIENGTRHGHNTRIVTVEGYADDAWDTKEGARTETYQLPTTETWNVEELCVESGVHCSVEKDVLARHATLTAKGSGARITSELGERTERLWVHAEMNGAVYVRACVGAKLESLTVLAKSSGEAVVTFPGPDDHCVGNVSCTTSKAGLGRLVFEGPVTAETLSLRAATHGTVEVGPVSRHTVNIVSMFVCRCHENGVITVRAPCVPNKSCEVFMEGDIDMLFCGKHGMSCSGGCLSTAAAE